ncbi:acetyl-CoA C-acyltransferase, partial [Vibrio sinaloensis]
MEKVYVVSAKRTPIGNFGGTLKDISAGNLASIAIKAALNEANVNPDVIDEVIVGNVIGAGQGMSVGRQ